MKTICIKCNNDDILNYLYEFYSKEEYKINISRKRFKNYNNIILHDVNRNEKNFYILVSNGIKNVIELIYESSLIKEIIYKNYFYLNSEEQEYVLKICDRIMKLPDSKIGYKNKLLEELIMHYIIENDILILDGFVKFRLKEYRDLLDNIVEVSVISFLELISMWL